MHPLMCLQRTVLWTALYHLPLSISVPYCLFISAIQISSDLLSKFPPDHCACMILSSQYCDYSGI